MKSLQEIFPRASKSFVAANPQVSAPTADSCKQNDSLGILRRKRGIPNATEQEFAVILEIEKREGKILRYEYEGITLRFAGVKYTPDFVVFDTTSSAWLSKDNPEIKIIRGIRLIEIKGAYTKGKFERAVERFRHAKTYWPEFQFEMWQKKKGEWKQII